MRLATLLVPAVALSASVTEAKIKLPALISDHMVLQQEVKVNVWGWAEPGEKVSVKFGDKTASTTAGADKRWSVQLEGLKVGTSGDLTIAGEDKVVVKDVLVGEVWVGSGQSNMEWSVEKSGNPEQEKAAANYPQIRMFTVTKAPSDTPKDDCVGEWKICSPANVATFSAVGYYFSRELHQKLKVPIGLIHTSWGGTPAEFWTPPAVLERNPGFRIYFDRWAKQKADYPRAKAAYDEAMAKWKVDAEKAKAENNPVPPAPRAPRGGDAFGGPGCLWNGMIEPVLPYTIQGAIWYQGESNANSDDEATRYRALFPTMILSWRIAWSQGGLKDSDNPEFPFLFVQLANFRPMDVSTADSAWARLREAQLMTLELPHTGMAVAIDIGEEKDIHPKNKQEVGRRLALSALAQVYYIDTEFSGPIYSGYQEEDNRIRLSFRNANDLKASDGGKVKGFEIAGEDKKFVGADVTIDGDHVLISSSQVPKPVAVRYAWADYPECNLVNDAGLPASPFRTDNWPGLAAAPAAK
jgi:sialate O-acetylesterase